jgi:hypothetical protein
MKKYLFSIVLLSMSFSIPLLAFAQQDTTNQGLTRAEVKSDLKNWEANGYKPGEDRADYPKQEQQIERKIQKEQSNNNSNTNMQY